jgi:hypothetical protein
MTDQHVANVNVDGGEDSFQHKPISSHANHLQVLNEFCSYLNFQSLIVSPLSLAVFRYLKLFLIVFRYPLSIFHFSSFFSVFLFSVFLFSSSSFRLLFSRLFLSIFSSSVFSFRPSFSSPFFLSHPLFLFFLSHSFFLVLPVLLCPVLPIPSLPLCLVFSFFLFLSSSSCLLLLPFFLSRLLLPFFLPSFFPSFSLSPFSLSFSAFLFPFFLFLIFSYHSPYLICLSTRPPFTTPPPASSAFTFSFHRSSHLQHLSTSSSRITPSICIICTSFFHYSLLLKSPVSMFFFHSSYTSARNV